MVHNQRKTGACLSCAAVKVYVTRIDIMLFSDTHLFIAKIKGTPAMHTNYTITFYATTQICKIIIIFEIIVVGQTRNCEHEKILNASVSPSCHFGLHVRMIKCCVCISSPSFAG